MRPLLALAAEPTDHAVSACLRREQQQHHESNESDCDERPLDHVFEHLGQTEEMIEPKERCEMQADVKKAYKPQYAAQFDQPVPVGQATQRRHPQCDAKKIQRPVASAARNKYDRIGDQTISERIER
jgi:hypothetical protein